MKLSPNQKSVMIYLNNNTINQSNMENIIDGIDAKEMHSILLDLNSKGLVNLSSDKDIALTSNGIVIAQEVSEKKTHKMQRGMWLGLIYDAMLLHGGVATTKQVYAYIEENVETEKLTKNWHETVRNCIQRKEFFESVSRAQYKIKDGVKRPSLQGGLKVVPKVRNFSKLYEIANS